MQKKDALADKRVFLVVSENEARRQLYSFLISESISNAVVFTAVDGADALFKIGNMAPHVLITDIFLPKISSSELIETILNNKQLDCSVIIATELPDTEHFVDEVVMGKVQFLNETEDSLKLNLCISKALNRLTDGKDAEYTLHFLAPGEILFNEGETAKSIFFVKRGRLVAFKNEGPKRIILGQIQSGEFVGEMAHLNHEPRSASVSALDNSELIEIPNGTLDVVLFSKPAWAQALMKTLSRRLKNSNEALAKTRG